MPPKKIGRPKGDPTQHAIEVAEKTREALDLKAAGASYATIAKHFDVSQRTVYRWIDEAIKEIPRESAEQWISIEIETLSKMQMGLWKQAVNGDTWAVDRILAIQDRRAKYLGLDKVAEILVTREFGSTAGEEAQSMMGGLLAGLQAHYTQMNATEVVDAEALETEEIEQ